MYDGESQRCAYIDKGGHIIFICLKSQTAFSKRLANPSLHPTLLMQCRTCIEGGVKTVLIAAHSNLLGSTWRPSSAPACPLQLYDNRWVVMSPRTPYLTCCTWSGDILWTLQLPVPARCLSCKCKSSFLVGADSCIFRVHTRRGVILEVYNDISAVEIVGCETSRGFTFAAKTDGDEHVVASLCSR